MVSMLSRLVGCNRQRRETFAEPPNQRRFLFVGSSVLFQFDSSISFPSLRQIALVWVEIVESGSVKTVRLDDDHVLPVQRLWPALRVKAEG